MAGAGLGATYFASLKPVAAAVRGLLKAVLTLRLRPETGQDLGTDSDTERGSSSSRETGVGGQQDTHERLIKYVCVCACVCVCVKRKTETDMAAGQRFGLQLSLVQERDWRGRGST